MILNMKSNLKAKSRKSQKTNLVVPSKRGGGSEVGATVGGRISRTPLDLHNTNS